MSADFDHAKNNNKQYKGGPNKGGQNKGGKDSFPARSPYNFVPFADDILLPKHAKLPGHDRLHEELHTGEIHVTLRAETPVFVSDGHKPNPQFFRGPNGRLAIPGSTMRGVIRENMQILGFGSVLLGEDIEDKRIFFRQIASKGAGVNKDLMDYYKEELVCKSYPAPKGKRYTIPERVKAGYLGWKGDKLFIQPVIGDKYIRVPRHNAVLRKAGLDRGEAATVKVKYTQIGQEIVDIRKCSKNEQEDGVLLYTGRSIGKGDRENARYLFPRMDMQANPVEISQEDRLSYAEDYETRENVLGEQKKKFWQLPEKGATKPVFYIKRNGHVYFGMTLFLRIGYKHRLAEGLPEKHREQSEQKNIPLDYVHAMLGFAEKKNAFRSRVTFGDFVAEGDPRGDSGGQKVVLGQPKPSWYPGYVVDGKHYNEDDFRLRGYKQYWLKQQPGPFPDEIKDNVASTLRPLPAGTRFKGVIRFRNLRDDELGLLLWALRLEKGCFQSVGQGKPYGFGRMRLSIDSLKEADIKKIYSSTGLCAAFDAAAANAVERYINIYDAQAAAQLSEQLPRPVASLRDIDSIKDFFYIHSTLRAAKDVDYMSVGAYKDLTRALPTIRQERQKAK